MESHLHRYAAARHGVLLTRELASLGHDAHWFRRLVRSEGWTPLFRGAYLMPGRVADVRAWTAAVQARWPQATASHTTAGALHGLPWCPVEPLVFTGPPGVGLHLPAARYVRSELAADEVVVLDGLRITSPARTIADLLLSRPRDDAVIVLDAALHTGLVVAADVAASLDRRSPHLLRVGAARQALALADGRSESPLETKARLLLQDAGHLVDVQVPFDTGERTVRVDLVVDSAVHLELEGTAYHGGRTEHLRDVRRFNEIAATGDGRAALRASFDDVFRHWPRTLALVERTVAAVRGRIGRARANLHPAQ